MKKRIFVVAAILVYHNRILCMQKGKTKYEYTSYKYEFPGGKIEAGETKEQALARELKEELKINVTIKPKDFFMEIQHEYDDFFVHLYFYQCQLHSPEIQAQEHINYKWLLPCDMKKLNWAVADIPVIEKLCQTLK